MKPKNSKNFGDCSPVSSNCVTYDGDKPSCDIIPFCYGESVSDILYKIMEKLCEFNSILNWDDIIMAPCLGETCGIENIKDVLNLLIQKVCEESNGNNATIDVPDKTCNCKIIVSKQTADCLDISAGEYNLDNYVGLLAQLICEARGNINDLASAVQSLQNSIRNVHNTYATQSYVKSTVDTAMGNIAPNVSENTKSIRGLRTNVGIPDEVVAAINTMPSSLATSPRFTGVGSMNTYPNWIDSPGSISQSMQDMWITIIDMRNAMMTLVGNLAEGCSDTNIEMDAVSVSVDSLVITFTGHVALGYVDTNEGSSITIIDRVTSMTQTVNGIRITQYVNGENLTIPLSGVSGDNDLDIRLTARTYNEQQNSTCERVFEAMATTTTTCPAVTYVPSFNSFAYSFNYLGRIPSIIVVEVYDATGTHLVGSVSHNVNGNFVSGNFYGLESGTTYKVRLVTNGRPCDFDTVMTNIRPCTQPVLDSINVDYDNPTGTSNGDNISAWINDYQSI